MNVSITANDSIGTNSIGTMHIYIYMYLVCHVGSFFLFVKTREMSTTSRRLVSLRPPIPKSEIMQILVAVLYDF